jgi:type IV pilus assembly protein PilX
MKQPIFTQRQRGVTLVITMLMLLLVTIVGVSMIRSTTTDERMAGATRDREKAFQAAEAAVQTCLTQVKVNSFAGTKLNPVAAISSAPNWEVAANWSNANSTEITFPPNAGDGPDAVGLAAWPRCMVESLGAGGESYRVTGRAVGGSSNTEVILQATYSTE